MGIRDSNHTAPEPRWGMDTGETVNVNVVEPPSGQKDTGWVPFVDVPVLDWFNWKAWATYVRLAYLARIFNGMLTVNSLFRRGKGTAIAEVTAGSGLSVNVALGRAWIDGARWEVAAVSNLALATADATHPRFDLVVMEVNSDIPSYAVVTGTPAAIPAEPSLASNQVALARVRVNAGATTPTSISDRRIFGSLALDEAQVDRTFKAGDLGGGDFLLEVDDDVVNNGRVRLLPVAGQLDIGSTLLTILPGASQILIGAASLLRFPAAAVEFSTPITRTYDISIYDFDRGAGVDADLANAGTLTDLVGNDPSGTGVGLLNDGDVGPGSESVRAGVRIPKNATITAVRIYGNRASNTPGLQFFFHGHKKGTGVSTLIASDANNGSGPTGDFTLAVTGLSHAVDGSETYRLLIGWVGSGPVCLHGAEVEYTIQAPFA